MTKLTFAFDVGSNSLGSAVVDKDNSTILHSGVSVFPMGVNLEKGSKEESKNLTRRLKRQGRRQNFRTRMRKELLAKELISHGMFPDIEMLYEKYLDKEARTFREKWEKVIRMIPLPDELRTFFAKDPYEIRHRAFKEEKLSLFEIGRALYHFAQRRGYKETLQDEGEDKGVLYEGDPALEKAGIDETKNLVSIFGTLGNALYHQDPHENRYRNRYTLRSMYQNEFDIVFKGQQPYYPNELTEKLYERLGGVNPTDATKNGILFYQRPLRSMKHLIGKCTFEPDKPKAPASSLDFERFRALQTINNIRIDGNPLEENDAEVLLAYILRAKKKLSIEQLAKKIKKPVEQFNYDPKDKIAASPTHANFYSIFKKKWDEFSEKEKEDIWHLKYWAEDPSWLEKKLERDYGLTENQIEQFKKFKMTKDYANLSRKAIKNINHFLEKGYQYDRAVLLAGVRNAMGSDFFDKLSLARQSEVEDDVLKAASRKEEGTTSIDRVKRLLLEGYGLDDESLGRLYHHSIKAEGDGSLKYLPEPEELKNPIVMQSLYQLRKVYNALVDEYGQPNEVRIELARELKSSKKKRDEIRRQQLEREAENDEIKEILDAHGAEHSPRNIQKLKLAEEIRRKCGRYANPYRPEQTFSISELLDGISVEVEHIIPYSISLNDSLGNKTLADKTSNDEKGKKTPYQYFDEYRPNEWAEVKERIFKLLPYQKAKRFVNENNPDAEEFISRQLNDTRYISRQATAYLKQVCKTVEITEGSVVGMLRYYWGLDGILSPSYDLEVPDGEYLASLNEEGEINDYKVYNPATKKKDSGQLAKKGELLHGQVRKNKFYLIKQREDHRHHALDAIVTAFTTRSYLQKVSTLLAQGLEKKELKYSRDHQLEPWKGFRTDVRKAINGILVHHSHSDRILTKVKKRLYTPDGDPKKVNGKELFAKGLAARGQLHEDSVFGKHTDNSGETFYHIRKPIDFVKGYKQWRTIVSPRVREAIYKRVKDLYPTGKLVNDELPEDWSLSDLDKEDQKKVFFVTAEDKTRQPMIHLSNKNGSPIPVKRVRTRERIGDAPQLKDGINQYVKTGNNHHCLAYEVSEGEIQFEFVSFWVAVERRKQRQPLFQMPSGGKRILNVFVRNELFVLGLSDQDFDHFLQNREFDQLSHHLYRVQKMSPSSYYAEFRKHTASNLQNKNDWQGFSSAKGYHDLNPIAVSIDVLGEIDRR